MTLSKNNSFSDKLLVLLSQKDFEKSLYMKYRGDIDLRLHELEKMIEDRDPTFWEEIFELFSSRITQIMEHLPEFMVFSLPRFILGKGFHSMRRLVTKAK